MGLTRYIQPEFFFGGQFLQCDNNLFGDFLGAFSFLVEIRKKNSTEMKEIANFSETDFFFSKKS
jgi:hypothetical protein